ncbi:MAG: hypothetical protein WC227_01025 [Patescibacteria group bacterium]|jgi:hypothetical protein
MKTKILVSLTTLNNPDWRKNVGDLKKFEIKEFALFPNCINSQEEREELFKTIVKELGPVSIPFAHIRSDMHPNELDFMIRNFGTKAVNLHPTIDWPIIHDLDKYKNMIYIENAGRAFVQGLTAEDLEGFAGVCLDLSHLESVRLQNLPGYEINIGIAEKYKIGAIHMSAIADAKMFIPEYDFWTNDRHYMDDLKQMDYLKRYYPKYFAPYAAIEVGNSIEDQIKMKKYIENILHLN